MTKTMRTESEMRTIYARASEAFRKGEGLTTHLAREGVPCGTFYSWCHRLGLPINFAGNGKTKPKKRAGFTEFTPTGSSGMKINFKGLTIECSTPEMLKMAVSTLVGE